MNVSVEHTVLEGVTNDTSMSIQSAVRTLGIVIGIFDICVGSVGNLMTIIAILSNKKLQTSFYKFIASLCCVDFLTASAMIPFNVNSYMTKKWLFGPDSFTCSFMAFSYYCCGYSSIVCLLVITVNRYVGIVHPRMYDTLFSKRRVWMTIVISWLVAPVLLSPFFFFNNYHGYGWFEGVTLCVFLIKDYTPQQNSYMNFTRVTFQAVPLVCMIIMYSVIFRTVQKSGTDVIKMSIKSAKSGDLGASSSFPYQQRSGKFSFSSRFNSSWRNSSFTSSRGGRSCKSQLSSVEERKRSYCACLKSFFKITSNSPTAEHGKRSNRFEQVENNNNPENVIPVVCIDETITLSKKSESDNASNLLNGNVNQNTKLCDDGLVMKCIETKYKNKVPQEDSGCASHSEAPSEDDSSSCGGLNNENGGKQSPITHDTKDRISLSDHSRPSSMRRVSSTSDVCTKPPRPSPTHSSRSLTMANEARLSPVKWSSSRYSPPPLGSDVYHESNISTRNDSVSSRKSTGLRFGPHKEKRRRSLSVMEATARQRRVMDRRLLRISLTICSIFMVLFLPSVIINLLPQAKTFDPSVHMFASIITWFNSCVNPIIYCFMNPKLRLEYKKIILKVSEIFLKCLGVKRRRVSLRKKRRRIGNRFV